MWLALALGLVVVRYPQWFADANRTARANASLDLVDRAIGGGNSVVPDQGLLLEARGRIPPTSHSGSRSASGKQGGAI